MNSKLKPYDCLKLSLKGFCMGTADIIPGISGGTIAFILGIYEELIQSIQSFNLTFLRLLFCFKFKQAFSSIAWKFLGSILVGIICAVFTLANIIDWLLLNEPVLINAFFFGLILATVPIIARIIKKWTALKIVTIIVCAACTYFFVSMIPLATPESFWFIFLSGAIAISAMILPGISGAFILVLLGKYQFILEAVHQRDFFVLSIFVAGIIVGIISFVRILSWLFKKFHDLTIAILTGLVIGSLNKIWPWKQTLKVIEGGHGKIIPIDQINIFPAQLNGEVVYPLLLALLGFILAIFLNTPRSIKIN